MDNKVSVAKLIAFVLIAVVASLIISYAIYTGGNVSL